MVHMLYPVGTLALELSRFLQKWLVYSVVCIMCYRIAGNIDVEFNLTV